MQQSHPDVNKTPGASERMKEINEAYAILGQWSSRAAYDHNQVTPPEETYSSSANTAKPQTVNHSDIPRSGSQGYRLRNRIEYKLSDTERYVIILYIFLAIAPTAAIIVFIASYPVVMFFGAIGFTLVSIGELAAEVILGSQYKIFGAIVGGLVAIAVFAMIVVRAIPSMKRWLTRIY